MNKLLCSSLLFTILVACSSASKAQLVKCRVCDAKTGKGIPFSSIATRDASKGCCSDIDGFFFADRKDTVKISSIGYLTKHTAISSIAPNDPRIIYLEETSIQVQELNIYGRKREKRSYITLTSYKNKDSKGTSYNQPGVRYAVLMDNGISKEGLIEKVTFKSEMERDKKQAANLRLRIYNVRTTSQKRPEDDLLFENVIVKPKNGWVTIDVSKYNVPFPRNGVFVGVDWLESNVMTTSNERINPGICYYFGKGGATTLMSFRETGWRPDGFIGHIGPGSIILKMKVSFNR